jgi:hypothetical protein
MQSKTAAGIVVSLTGFQCACNSTLHAAPHQLFCYGHCRCLPTHRQHAALAQAAADPKRAASLLPADVATRAAAVASVLDQPDAVSMCAAAAQLEGAPPSPAAAARPWPLPADAPGLRSELAAVDAQQREAEALRAKLGAKLSALRERAGELGELQAEKRALEEKVGSLWRAHMGYAACRPFRVERGRKSSPSVALQLLLTHSAQCHAPAFPPKGGKIEFGGHRARSTAR